MLALLILVGILAGGAVVYAVIRAYAALAEKKRIAEEERKKRLAEEREREEKRQMELKMHQEEALAMAKNNPELVSRVIRNWLT